MVKADERPSEVLTTDVLRSARGRMVRPKTSGQKRYVDAIRKNIVTFGIGPAGTGKSWLAVAMAVQALQSKDVDRIILTRPAVEAGERLGFLPGDLMAKVDPDLRPLYDALHDMVDAEGVQRMLRARTTWPM
jgi:phosphate starvation-inducible PhoH-like protein